MHAMRQMIAAIAVRGGKPPRSFSVLDVTFWSTVLVYQDRLQTVTREWF
eukprot:COSAG06_NODE_5435_length_3483_cov_2.515071_2_plen_49_part_00